jgi:hypothetical protein
LLVRPLDLAIFAPMQLSSPAPSATKSASNSMNDKWASGKRRIRALKRVLIAKAELRRANSLATQKRAATPR